MNKPPMLSTTMQSYLSLKETCTQSNKAKGNAGNKRGKETTGCFSCGIGLLA